MKIFDKSSKLEHVSYDIRGPILDEATRMIANGEKSCVLILVTQLNLALQHQTKSFEI